MSLKSVSVLWKCLCALLCIGLFVFLAFRVSEKAHPWEKSVIDNGIEGGDFTAQTMGGRKIACFSPDEKTLYVSTASGLIQAWDLEKMRLKTSFGVKVTPESEGKNLHLEGAWNLEVNNLGQVVEYRWDRDENGELITRLLIHTQDGKLVAERDLDNVYKRFSVSKDGQWMVGGRLRSTATSLKTGKVTSLSPDQGFNGGNRRLQWSKDGKKLLFSEALMFCLYDVKSWKADIIARTEFIDLVNEAKKEQAEPVDKNRKWLASLIDSQFVDGDRKIASVYNAEGWGMRSTDPNENVLRFTSVETGELLKSISLPASPRSMWVSADGKKVYVTMCPDFMTTLTIYDTESMENLASVFSKITNNFPTQAMALNGGGNHIVQYSSGAVMQDWEETYTPVRFESLNQIVLQVLTNKKSDLLVTVLNSREIHVWKKRREFSKWGAFALWEYGASYLCMFALFLLPVYWAKKASEKSTPENKRPFRKLEWIILVIAAITLATTVARAIYQPIFGDIWLYSYEGMNFPVILGIVLAISCFLGLLWRNDGWRKFNRLISLLGGLLFLGLLIYLFILILNIHFDVFILVIAESSADGLKWSQTLGSSLLWGFLLSSYLFFKCWVLRVPFKKEKYDSKL